jgi:hypothetical protein
MALRTLDMTIANEVHMAYLPHAREDLGQQTIAYTSWHHTINRRSNRLESLRMNKLFGSMQVHLDVKSDGMELRENVVQQSPVNQLKASQYLLGAVSTK